MLDGTPVVDIKPYLPDCDVYTVERVGWYAQAHGACVADNRFSQGPEFRPS
jgi:tRNA (adenine37-N6)-methyltransferase